ncbi:alpha/beta hydrolase family protein [Caulobacter henricii]|uniref:alpha/beta hydrolase family protein n=1 Tax=Caulobacter henricii TaxID=69395 RepID=UPI000AAA2D5D|nr:alpha/beta fold hydrolase [Caulobacter henricii]
MRKPWLLLLLGMVLVLGGSALAWKVQTAGGIRVTEVTFAGTGGTPMSGLLYTPPNATAATPSPGVLAVHGYINSRETQSGFAIEFARRGYVVLALDQTGHGYSGGPAFSNGFGGPDGLKYLRSLPTVDPANIGLEGHSMGGWTVLAAAATMPDAYRSVVLEGSSTGKPFAADGSPVWPRNLALVFSQYDEFSKLMWGVDRAKDVTGSAKLQAVFGATGPVQPGKVYGSVADGTARMLQTPATTHPGDHISPAAIGHALDWFALTLKGGTPRPASDQIWMWKEAGTGIALIGTVVLLLGTFQALLTLKLFAPLRQAIQPTASARDGRWWRGVALSALLPAVTFFPLFILGMVALPANGLLKQAITNQVLTWAVVTASLTLGLAALGKGARPGFSNRWPLSLLIGLISVGVVYGTLELVHRLFLVDFRFWVVALKRLSPAQAGLVLVYVLPLTLAFGVTLRTLLARIPVAGESNLARYGSAVLALSGGFALLLALDYGALFLTGRLPTAFDPLSTVVAIQFLPLTALMAVIGVFTWKRTGGYAVATVICGLLLTWYMVAGTATQVV